MAKTFPAVSTLFLAVLLTAAVMNTGLAHDTKAAGKKTFVARVVDLACYVGHGSVGDSHRECATACAKTGIPLAILDQKANTLYLPLSKDHHAAANAELLPFVEKDVRVTGMISEKDGLKTIVLESIEAAK